MGKIEYNLLCEALALRAGAKLITTPEELTIIIRSANTQNLTILKDASGSNVGYIACGAINKYSALNLINNGILPRYFYEFYEGNICLVVSVFICPDRSYEGINRLKTFIKNKRAITYIKKGKAVFLIRKKNKFHKGIRKQFAVTINPAPRKAV